MPSDLSPTSVARRASIGQATHVAALLILVLGDGDAEPPLFVGLSARISGGGAAGLGGQLTPSVRCGHVDVGVKAILLTPPPSE